MAMLKGKARRRQGWLLLTYGLAVLSMNCKRGEWRDAAMGFSTAVLVVVVGMMARARWGGACAHGGPGARAI